MTHDSIDLAALLRREGYRMTLQRQLVLDAVCDAGGHATPDEIFEIVRQSTDAVNRTTVYRTLHLLQDLNLLDTTTSIGGHLKYEIAKSRPHHHLLCVDCGTDIELPHEDFAPLLDHLEERYGFVVEPTHLTYHGRCAGCLEPDERK